MKCELCKGDAVERRVSYTLFYEGHWVIVEHVPARVCQQCGETLFDPDVVERLQEIMWSKQEPDKKIETPIYEFA